MPTVEEQLGTLNNAVAALASAVGVSQTTMNANVATAGGSATAASNSAATAGAARDATQVLRDAMQTLSSGISAIALAAGSGPATSLQYPALAALLATATDVVDVFVYDCRRDSDGGEWTQKCSRTSWFNEALGTATRGARREFPKIAALVLRNVYAAVNTLTIYDLTDLDGGGIPRMWAVFQAGANLALRQTGILGTANNFTSVFALNGRIWVGGGISAGTGGLSEIDLPNDTAFYTVVSGSGLNARFPVGLSQRNTYAAAWTTVANGRNQGIVDRNVFHVHARVLPGAELDAAGLPIPTVLVSTAGGASVIHPNGTVYDIVRALGYYRGLILPDNRLMLSRVGSPAIQVGPVPYADFANDQLWHSAQYAAAGPVSFGSVDFVRPIAPGAVGGETSGLYLFAEDVANPNGSMVARVGTNFASGWQPSDCRLASLCDVTTGNITGSGELIANGTFNTDLTGWTVTMAGTSTAAVTSGQAVLTADGTNAVTLDQSFATVSGQTYLVSFDAVAFSGGSYGVTAGTSQGGSQLASLTSQTATGRVFVQFTATGATSWIRIAKSLTAGTLTLDNVSCQLAIPDRSYRGRGLIPVGTIGRAAVASGDAVVFSGFSASNYLQQPYNPDFDFTGDFAISCWIDGRNVTTGQRFIAMERCGYSGAYSGAGFRITSASDGSVTFRTTPDGFSTIRTISAAAGALAWGAPLIHCAFVRRGTALEIWIDGRLAATSTVTVDNLTNTAAILRAGVQLDGAGAMSATPGLGLFRTAAYAPTPAQIRRMYRDELALFGTGVRCTLGGTSNAVQKMAFDDSTNTLIVGTGDGVSVFNGLTRVNYFDTSNVPGLTNDNIQGLGAAAGFMLIAGTAQAVARRDAVNGLDSMYRYGPRAPYRDGICRSSGRTTDATPLNLSPRLFVGEREHVRGDVRVVGKMVGATGTQRFSTLLEFVATRDAGGNVTLNLAAASQKDPLWNGTAAIDGTVETTSTTDAAVVVDTASQTLALQVTGIAATQMAWTADWTFSRIAEDSSYVA